MGGPRKLVFEFDPFESLGMDRSDFSKKNAREALEEMADYVKTEVLQHVGSGTSPVSGGPWKKSLSPEYKKIKEKISSSSIANLELRGDMLDALEARVVGGKIQIGFWDSEQAKKAYNHNVGDTLPQRQILPEDGQEFKSPIKRGLREIAESFMDEE